MICLATSGDLALSVDFAPVPCFARIGPGLWKNNAGGTNDATTGGPEWRQTGRKRL